MGRNVKPKVEPVEEKVVDRVGYNQGLAQTANDLNAFRDKVKLNLGDQYAGSPLETHLRRVEQFIHNELGLPKPR